LADIQKILHAHPHKLSREEFHAVRSHHAGQAISDEHATRLLASGHIVQKLGGYQTTDIGHMRLMVGHDG